jgi:DNA-binding NtrC family response regulator
LFLYKQKKHAWQDIRLKACYPLQRRAAMKFKQIAKTIPGNRQKVLVMDNDPHCRMLALTVLEECGYETHLTKNGNETVDQYSRAKANGRPFDVVILDLDVINLHGIGGQETMRSLLDIDPGIRAVVSSGDRHHPAIIDHKKYGFCGALPKPFTEKDIQRVLSRTDTIDDQETEHTQ